MGSFCFDNGKVLLPDVTDQKRLAVFKEVNQAISSLSA
ncbi:hypothetical protein D042_2784 [Vibrio parahaemolyticus NIHCB0757]|nr:hypothetical protein D042_2784 [Vibrio parahaemolyticus NIHCB0757]